MTTETPVLAQLWPLPCCSPQGLSCRPAPPRPSLGRAPCRVQPPQPAALLTRSFWRDWLSPLCDFKQMILQAALLQSLEQKVPSGASGARKSVCV